MNFRLRFSFLFVIFILYTESSFAWLPSSALSQKRINLLAGKIGAEEGSGYNDGIGRSASFGEPVNVSLDNDGFIYVLDTCSVRKISPTGVVSTFAGNKDVCGENDGTGSAARFSYPSGIAVDNSGTIYVGDTYNNTIRKISPSGVVTTLAGVAGASGANDGTGNAARFHQPFAIVIDASGDLIVSDLINHTIRKVTPAGVVTTFAGSAGAMGSSDGTGTAARFTLPTGLTRDSSGNIFVADRGNDTIRKITPAGVVSTFAGTAGVRGATDATGSAASFNQPWGIAVDTSDNLYVSDYYNTIRKISPTRVVTTFAGQSNAAGIIDAQGVSARFNGPKGLGVDSNGNVYVADSSNYTIRKISSSGTVTSLAGTAGMTGSNDGLGSAARFYQALNLAVDSDGNIFVIEAGNNTIRKITPAGLVSTLAGSPKAFGTNNGTGSAARFSTPYGIAVDSSGNVYVGDTFNQTIRKMTPSNVVTTLAGMMTSGGSADGTGSAARFSEPTGVAVDSGGNTYVADSTNNTIRKITPLGLVTTLAGTAGVSGSADGTGSAASFNYPMGVAVDSSDNIFVADTYNNSIRKITPAGVVTTFAGSTTGAFGSTNATGTAARFNTPQNLAIDSANNIYVADSTNSTIRKITTGAVVTTLAGRTGAWGTADGTGTNARFSGPTGVAVDSSGNVYVADRAIRKISPAGEVTTLAGFVNQVIGVTDATGSQARFYNPDGVAVDSNNNVFVADKSNNTIRKITPNGVVTTLAGTYNLSGRTNGTGIAARFDSPSDLAVDASGNVFVADSYNNSIRKITSAGVVTNYAGSTSGASGGTDANGSSARFNNPQGIAVDSSGIIYVADTDNHTIRKITAAGDVTTFAGAAGVSGATNATGSAARFNMPTGVSVDLSGNVYVADNGNHTIRKITSAGVVTTLAGVAGTIGTADGTGSLARFNYPNGVSVDSGGNVYVSDNENSTIRKVSPTGAVSTVVGNRSSQLDLTFLPAKIVRTNGIATKNGRIYFSSQHAIFWAPSP